MSEKLPSFRYHPDPLATGMVEASPETCACCARARGHVYLGLVHSTHEVQPSVCPWCIADGSAATRLRASFSDERALASQGVPKAVIDEVSLRTPGYTSWQQDWWLAHCGDACAFHGDATAADLRAMDAKEAATLRTELHLDEAQWEQLVEEYQPCGDPAFYKFVCLHCGCVRISWDCS